jgi:hypothetical protein
MGWYRNTHTRPRQAFTKSLRGFGFEEQFTGKTKGYKKPGEAKMGAV